jgi:2-(3-amino-3-carboxypropyl)histidine synthase
MKDLIFFNFIIYEMLNFLKFKINLGILHMLVFDLELENVINKIINKKARKILIQLPEGLKQYGFKISDMLKEKTEAVIYLSSNPCYGGCDLAIKDAKELGCDLIIHYGHSPFITDLNLPVLYIRARAIVNIDFRKKIENELPHNKKVGIASTIQYLEIIEEIKEILESNGCSVIIPPKIGKIEFTGQILGCEYSSLRSISNKVDYYLIIGSRFHSLGASLKLEKPVFLLDPYLERIENIEPLRKTILKQRYALISKAKSLNKFGILIGTKLGQFNHENALRIRNILESCGKKSVLIVINEITSNSLDNFIDVDVFVNTACPRVSIDDVGRFNKPIITEKECMVALGKLNWMDLIEKGFF